MTDKHTIWVAFVDMLVCLLVGVLCLFVLSLTVISPDTETKPGVELKAEYIISVLWEDPNADVDLWMRDPDGNIIWFRNKEAGLMHLDFDNMGEYNNRVLDGNGVYQVPKTFEEVATIRGTQAGEYTVNVHLYSHMQGEHKTSTPGIVVKPVVVHVKIQKLNPTVSTIFEKDLTFTHIWEEQTATRFTVHGNGDFDHLDDTPANLLQYDKNTDSTQAVPQVHQ